jgi:hypothetical protein
MSLGSRCDRFLRNHTEGVASMDFFCHADDLVPACYMGFWFSSIVAV